MALCWRMIPAVVVEVGVVRLLLSVGLMWTVVVPASVVVVVVW